MNEEEKNAIELLEEFIKYYEAEATSRKFRGTLSIRVDEDDIDALENLINMYKRILKENEELKENCKKCIIRDELDEYVNNSIPVQKIKDKLRKNDEIIEDSNDGDLIHELCQKNKVYKELLEKEQ